MFANNVTASDMRERSTALKYCGKAMAAKIPMMSTTTKSSIRVNPLLVFIKPPTVLYTEFCNPHRGYKFSVAVKEEKIKTYFLPT